MIVKIKNNREKCWNYFEGDNVIQHIYEPEQRVEHCNETLYLYDSESGCRARIGLTINKDNKVVSRILTNQPTYLMNNEGKTIDKLL